MGISKKLTRRAFLQRTALSLPALAALQGAAAQGMTQGMGPAATAAPEMLPPPPPAARPRKVIVVGAGLAGLAAAYELVAWGHDVTVLEAQTRPGGRVLTLRSFADGLFAEAGAIDFTESARRMKHYVKTLGLTTSERQPTDLITPFHLRGQRVLDRPGIKTQWPYEFSEEEKKLPGFFQMYQKYLGRQANELGDPTDPKWDIQAFKHLDQLTVADFMKSRGASDEAVEYLSHQMVPGYGWRTGSALHRLASDFALYNKGGGRNHFIDGGSDMLPRAFARSLRERIFYGAPVSRIVQEGGKVRAVFRPGGSGPEESLEADYLICTAPGPVLRRTEFSPGLPPRKRLILRELEYTPVTRIFVQTRTRFWLDQNMAGGGNTDLPIKVVAEHPSVRPEGIGRRGILECHIRGADALPVDAMDLDEQIAFAVEGLEKLHPGFSRQVEGGTAYSWHNDPWAGGGYPWWKPGQLTEWMPELAKPEGRVHFAGEHTSVLPRTMEGALISAERAAREVHEAASREA